MAEAALIAVGGIASVSQIIELFAKSVGGIVEF